MNGAVSRSVTDPVDIRSGLITMSADTSVSWSVVTKLAFDEDDGSSSYPFDTTNNRFYCPVGGTYRISMPFQPEADNQAGGGSRISYGYVYVNGVEDTSVPNPTTYWFSPGGLGAEIECEAGDYIEMYFSMGTNDTSTNPRCGASGTSLRIHLV